MKEMKEPTSLDQMDWPPMELADPTPEEIKKMIEDYTNWNEWLVAGGGLVKTMDAVLLKVIKDKTAQKAIDAACHSFYDAAQGMNKQVVIAIKGLEQTPPVLPKVVFGPIDLPDWPDMEKPNLFSSVWEIAQPLLEMLDKKLLETHPDEPIVIALGGLIDAGQKIIDTLSKYYPEWAPGGKK